MEKKKQISDLKEEMRKLSDRNFILLNEKHKVEADNESIRLQLRTAEKEVIEHSSVLNSSQVSWLIGWLVLLLYCLYLFPEFGD